MAPKVGNKETYGVACKCAYRFFQFQHKRIAVYALLFVVCREIYIE